MQAAATRGCSGSLDRETLEIVNDVEIAGPVVPPQSVSTFAQRFHTRRGFTQRAAEHLRLLLVIGRRVKEIPRKTRSRDWSTPISRPSDYDPPRPGKERLQMRGKFGQRRANHRTPLRSSPYIRQNGGKPANNHAVHKRDKSGFPPNLPRASSAACEYGADRTRAKIAARKSWW